MRDEFYEDNVEYDVGKSGGFIEFIKHIFMPETKPSSFELSGDNHKLK